MGFSKLEKRKIKSDMMSLLIDKAPDNIRIMRLYEIFNKYDTELIDSVIDELVEDSRVIKVDPLQQRGRRPHVEIPTSIEDEYRKRISITLASYSNIDIKGELLLGDSASIIRFLPYTALSASELNEVVDVFLEKINQLDNNFNSRIQKEISRIYKEMITIFGVFVSIFGIIVIATDKMLRFSPDVLSQGWRDLFIKSVALFLPVGIVIFTLVWFVTYQNKK